MGCSYMGEGGDLEFAEGILPFGAREGQIKCLPYKAFVVISLNDRQRSTKYTSDFL